MTVNYYEAPKRAACSGCHPSTCLLDTCLVKIYDISTPALERPAQIVHRQEVDRATKATQIAFLHGVA